MKDKVIFRQFKGETIAVFPYIFHNGALNVCFDGSHSSCDYHYIMQNSKPSQPEDYKYLNRILHNFFGYDTQVITRYKHSAWLKAYYSSKKQTQCNSN